MNCDHYYIRGANNQVDIVTQGRLLKKAPTPRQGDLM